MLRPRSLDYIQPSEMRARVSHSMWVAILLALINEPSIINCAQYLWVQAFFLPLSFQKERGKILVPYLQDN
jgi:hypothetical protein